MKSIRLSALCMLVTLPAMLLLMGNTVAQTEQLISQLAAKMGVSQQQVGGGIGALMKYAEQSLTPEQFNKIADDLPELAGLRSAAPAGGEDASTVKKLSALLGDDDTAAQAEKLANLRNSLDQLGLSSEQIAQFVPAIIDYAKSRGGDAIANLLKEVLPAV